MKGKREKERYTHLNAEFQRIARRDKKAFLSDIYIYIFNSYILDSETKGNTNKNTKTMLALELRSGCNNDHLCFWPMHFTSASTAFIISLK